YWCSTFPSSTHLLSVAPSSSRSSRANAASASSPASIFPPGNSHLSGDESFLRRWPIRIRRSARSITAATTLIMSAPTSGPALGQNPRQFSSAPREDRCRSVQQFVAHNENTSIFDRRNVLPLLIPIGACRLRTAARRRPRKNDHIGILR